MPSEVREPLCHDSLQLPQSPERVQDRGGPSMPAGLAATLQGGRSQGVWIVKRRFG